MIIVKNGIINGRFPIITCKIFEKLFCETFSKALILLETKIMNGAYA
jgi:hypothetical protein